MKKFILLLLLCVVTLSCYSSTKSSSSRSSSGVKDKNTEFTNSKALAVASVKRGNFQQALIDLEPAEKINKKDPEIYLIKGIVYYGLKDNELAEENYLKSLKLDPKYTEARYNLCGLYLFEEKNDQAIEQCSIAAADPTYRARPSALTNLGIAYFMKGDVNRAKQYYDKALEINPAYVYTHNELGKLYTSIGKEQDAIQEFKLAISGFPEYAEAHYNLGVVYLKEGNKIQACYAFRKVTELSPNSSLGVNSTRYLNSVCAAQYTN